jgi:dCMP deaminase
MPDQKILDNYYMDVAYRTSIMSHAVRKKVGAVIVKGDNIISYGWNGTPTGDDNACEYEGPDGALITKDNVLHAELNAIMKLARMGGVGSQDSTLYVTMSPCHDCAKLIKQAGITRVVYSELYRETSGLKYLNDRNVSTLPLETEP